MALVIVHGGMKTYRGDPAAARCYVESELARADEYYLAEGSGIALHYTASAETGVRELAPLTGERYAAWVAGVDPETGVPKGQLRHDSNAVRFVEVVVNGPKSWSLAAALHDDISIAYDSAQERAAQQIVGWLAQHATTRVGPRGQQIQILVERLEAAVVRHHSSRAGDPHRHLHVQLNARVLAEGRWRALHTVGVRDSLDAINGIGHAAVMTDPAFRAALARHGYTLDLDSGEIAQLAPFVGRFSARAAQIGRNIDRYETAWRATNPGREPGPGLRQAWDRRAWAEARPDKVVPRDGAAMTAAWVAELRQFGYRDPRRGSPVRPLPAGRLDRDAAVAEVVHRLSARRSGWNAADIRGEIEQLLARRNIVTDADVRSDLAEDLTARTVAECVPLTARAGLPEHVRGLTSRHVLDVEADIVGRFALRAVSPVTARELVVVDAADGLDTAQREAAAMLAGDAWLLVVEGAAGAGKTATLAAARSALAVDGRRLVVVTPTLKAARVASGQLGTSASSAAALAHRHGFRWNDMAGGWTRLALGQSDPVTDTIYTGPSQDAQLRAGDLLLVDEAGMLDQDSARALLTIADETGARVALVGDRHQLAAVGRGGVLDLAARYVQPEACLTLDTIHRFSDPDYARLSLAMRAGVDPGAVFDTLHARGQIRLHASEVQRRDALARQAVQAIIAGEPAAVVADTREQVAELNATVRDQLITRRVVADTETISTAVGERIGVGDRVATRRNDPDLAVANRDTWTVTGIGRDGTVTVTGEPGQRQLPAGYAAEHLELAYASTVHGAQGDTVTTGHMVVGEHTSAAAAYVGMTRGRQANTAHLVAENVDEAREQWAAVFGRDRADLGPAHAAYLAERDAARYAELRPLDDVLRELREAWTVQADARDRLAVVEQRRSGLAEVITLRQQRERALAPLLHAHAGAQATAEAASRRADQADQLVAAHAASIAADLQQAWDQQRDPARHAAQVIETGPGRFGQRRGAVHRASEQLLHWSATWQPYLPAMPTRLDDIVRAAAGHDTTLYVRAAFTDHARTVAAQTHPETAAAHAAADTARQHAEQASRAVHDIALHYTTALSRYGRAGSIDDPDALLNKIDQQLTGLRNDADTAHDRVTRLLAEPSLRVQPRERITTEHDRWHADRQAEHAAHDQQRRIERLRHTSRPGVTPPTPTPPTPDVSRHVSR